MKLKWLTPAGDTAVAADSESHDKADPSPSQRQNLGPAVWRMPLTGESMERDYYY